MFHPPGGPASSSDQANDKGSSQKPSPPTWQPVIIGWVPPTVLAISLLLAGWLHFKAAQVARSGKLSEPDHVKATMVSQVRPLGLHEGAKVRVIDHLSLSDIQKNQPPRWIGEMDQYSGRECLVAGVSADGWLRLENIPFDFRKEWVQIVSPESNRV